MGDAGAQKDGDNSSSSSGLKAAFLLALAFAGIPVVGGAVLWQWATQHALLAVILLAAYWLLALLASIASAVWQDKRRELVRWLDVRITWLFSGYYRRYRRYLINQHRDLAVKGTNIQGPFDLPVEDVFVELNISPTVPGKAAAKVTAQLPPALREGPHPIWDYLKAPLPVLARQQLAILGDAGSGKTTLLKYIALTLVINQKQRRKAGAFLKLPILLFLREHWEAICANPDLSLAEVVQEQVKKQKCPAPPHWFTNQIEQGRCLVLLDGLDEVADATARKRVVGWVEQQMRNHGQNRFILTSRPFGFDNAPISGVMKLMVHPFTHRQIEQFARNWYISNEILRTQRDDTGVRNKALEGAKDLLQQLEKAPALLELAKNPLLLTMIATLHHYHHRLPKYRAELYAEVCPVFLGRNRERISGTADLTTAQKQSVLQPLAYHLMRYNTREISVVDAQNVIGGKDGPLALVNSEMSVAEYFELVKKSGSLLIEFQTGSYGFAHKTFQEYLAAVHIKEHRLEADLFTHINDPWWHETIRLYAAQTDATAIIQACLDAQPSSAAVLSLAIECNEEKLQVKEAVANRVKLLLERGVEDPDPERRRIITDALLTRRLRDQMVPWKKEEILTATTFVNWAEYQLFLDEQEAQGHRFQPDHWLIDGFSPSKARQPILGVRPNDANAFCDWLNVRESGSWRYRLPRHNEISPAQLGQAKLQELSQGFGYWSSVETGFNRWTLERDHAISRAGITAELYSDLFQKPIDSLAEDRASALADAHLLAQQLATTFSRASKLARQRSADLGMSSDVAEKLAYASALSRNLAGVFESQEKRTLARDLPNQLHRARTNTHALDLPAMSSLAHTTPRYYARTPVDFAGLIDFALERPGAPARAQMLDYAHALDAEIMDGERAILNLRWLIRFASLIIAEQLLWDIEYLANRPWWKRLGYRLTRRRNINRRVLPQTAEAYLGFYVHFTILQARTQGDFHPFEGILIMKERKPGYA